MLLVKYDVSADSEISRKCGMLANGNCYKMQNANVKINIRSYHKKKMIKDQKICSLIFLVRKRKIPPDLKKN